MKEAIEQIQKQLAELKAASQKEVEDARVRLLGKKGSITALMEEFRTIAPELKREYGQKLNELKKAATAKIEELKEQAAAAAVELAPKQDLSMPGDPFELGSRHPVSIVRQEIVDIFRKFGYDVAEARRSRTTGTCSRRSISRRITPPARCRTPSSCPTAT